MSMDEKKFNVVYSGKFAEGKPRNEIERSLSKIFKLDINSVKDAFGGSRKIVKKDVNYETALKIADVINKAGAICTVEESDDQRGKSVPKEQEKGQKTYTKITVVFLEFLSANVAYSPLQCPKITAFENGIDINRAERKKIDYQQIEFISVFQMETCKIVFFVKDSKRPYIADCDTIIFSDFPNVPGQSLLNSLRRFLVYLLKKKSGIIIDNRTHEFIRGGQPIVFKGDVALLTTSIKKALSPQGVPLKPLGPEIKGREIADLESGDGKRAASVTETCPKCGTERVPGRGSCSRCGLSFARLEGAQKSEENESDNLEIQIEKNDAMATEEYEEDLDAETALRQVDAWNENYTRFFSVMLILGMLLPIIKQSELYSGHVVLWPWQIMGLGVSEDMSSLLKGFSGRAWMVLWSLVPITAGVAGLLSIKLLSTVYRAILVTILGMVVFLLLVTVFISESRILGVIFLPETYIGGILYVVFLLSAGMIAMGNHLRKRFKRSNILRMISGGGGVVLCLLTCFIFIISSGARQALPMLILYSLIVLYAVLGVYSAYNNAHDPFFLSLISKTSRVIISWAFFAALVVQSYYPDPTLVHVTAGGGVIIGLSAVMKCTLIYMGSAFMMVMGAASLFETALIKRSD